jgi:3-oxoacyl-[acyl-carrier protein] reductase
MIERKSGSIVALGGLWSLTARRPGTGGVTASKHGLYGLIKAMAIDLESYGIRANLIAVGPLATERRNPAWYQNKAGEPLIENQGGKANTASLLERRGTPQEVANVALFFASDESSYVTGDRIICGGGKYM